MTPKVTNNFDVAQSYILDGIKCQYTGKHVGAWARWLRAIKSEPVLNHELDRRRTFLNVCRRIGLGKE